MKSGGSKRKGSAFERKICKALSLWVTAGKRKDAFWRTAMSGGRATVHGLAVRQAGDITAVAEEGLPLVDLYVIECKHYRDLNIAAFVLVQKGKLAKFWRKVCKEADRNKKRPMLIAKQNAYPTFVVEGTKKKPVITLLSTLLKQPPPPIILREGK